MSIMKRVIFYSALGVLVLGALFAAYGRSYWHPLYLMYKGKRTVTEVVAGVGPGAISRLLPAFERLGITYPPTNIALIAFKDTKQLQLWAGELDKYQLVKTYSILAASGTLGPKLMEGDQQVPEGIYAIEYLNPNSAYYLSMKLNYPNAFDAQQAKLDGREYPGTNIFIHGKAVSVGCLAMGDEAIEELFTLSHDVGSNNVRVIISPSNPANGPLITPPNSAHWVGDLYKIIEQEIAKVGS